MSLVHLRFDRRRPAGVGLAVGQPFVGSVDPGGRLARRPIRAAESLLVFLWSVFLLLQRNEKTKRHIVYDINTLRLEHVYHVCH